MCQITSQAENFAPASNLKRGTLKVHRVCTGKSMKLPCESSLLLFIQIKMAV